MKVGQVNTDSAFWIGKTHRVCQDYVLAAHGQEEACIILADGCSSSPDTDIGVRLLVKSAERLLPAVPVAEDDRAAWEAYHARAVHHAADYTRRLDLSDACLDATLLTIKMADGAFVAGCYGDGVVALGRRDGRIEVYTISFAASYPQYPSYLLDGARRQRWEAQPGNAKCVEKWVLGGVGEREAEARPSQGAVELFTGSTADYRFVAVLSDGVQSFGQIERTDTTRTTLPLAAADVLVQLLAFKGGRGQFVQRRVQAFQKACQGHGWHHADDMSLGVVWLDD